MRTTLFSLIATAAAVTAAAGEGLVNVPVGCMRDEPRHAAQMVSQAVAGTPLEITDTVGEWLMVTTPDGYSGYMTAQSVTERPLDEWRSAPRVIVTSPGGATVTAGAANAVVVRLPLNSILEAAADGSVMMPDGRSGMVTEGTVADFETLSARDFDPQGVTSTAFALMGAPYLWGGMSGAAMDCSGLVSLCYFANGMVIRRDAWMQSTDSAPLDHPEAPADLIFFDRSGNGKIDHVAIHDRDGRYIHCSGMVKVNHLSAEQGDTISGRVAGFGRPQPGRGLTPVSLHPAYFNQR